MSGSSPESKDDNLKRKPIRKIDEDPADIMSELELDGMTDHDRVGKLLQIVVQQNREMEQMRRNNATSMEQCANAMDDLHAQIAGLKENLALARIAMIRSIDAAAAIKDSFVTVKTEKEVRSSR